MDGEIHLAGGPSPMESREAGGGPPGGSREPATQRVGVRTAAADTCPTIRGGVQSARVRFSSSVSAEIEAGRVFQPCPWV